jgi:hypothetical protein
MHATGSLSFLLLSLGAGCSATPGDDTGSVDGDRDAEIMAQLVGAWLEEVHYWTANSCPVDVTGPDYTGVGWYLVVTPGTETTGTARLCGSIDAVGACVDEFPDLNGTVSVDDGVAQWSYQGDFMFFTDLDCQLREDAVVDLAVDGDELVMTTTAVVSVVGGSQCAETEARLQEESGLDDPLDGCGGVQHNELSRAR